MHQEDGDDFYEPLYTLLLIRINIAKTFQVSLEIDMRGVEIP